MRGLGFNLPKRWPTQDELRTHKARMLRSLMSSARGGIYLGSPTILDQKDTGSCTGFAAVQCAHIALGTPIRSPLFSYWTNRIAGGMTEANLSDDGADPDGVKLALNTFGLAPMIDAPFDPNLINRRPHDLAFTAAQPVKANLSPIFETGSALFDACAHVIEVERKPLFLAIEVVPAYDNSTNTSGYADDPYGDVRGLHAICGYGTNAGIVTAGSWGTGFGLNGSVELSPRFVGARVVYAAAFEIEAA